MASRGPASILGAADPLHSLLQTVSVELVAIDKASIRAAGTSFAPGTEVFIANLPKHEAATQVQAAIELRRSGMKPVPHLVARNLRSAAEFDTLLQSLNHEAVVDTALVLGGDRDQPQGPFEQALQLLEAGSFERHGFRRIYLAAYPEGHRHIADAALAQALRRKLAAAESARVRGHARHAVLLRGTPDPAVAHRIARRGHLHALPHRRGRPRLEGTSLLKFALLCGVGPSLRALQGREQLAGTMLSGETPEQLLRDVATARSQIAELGIDGVHFFTFGSLAKVAAWLDQTGPRDEPPCSGSDPDAAMP